ncbi:UDP-N-acetylglucosamine 2-epimerase [Cellulomonas sp. KRMCY2]|uniref:UDP-N-acetylglucosamine 2-epimerase n=1 Tax=Cellulomonas sp. KRMCY2 TaxID=1304865 RepID=UPI00045E9150|nr:UDP-N-acetylglucosamine 2-epimerase [Cellulomonas sp. KRMCY2]
MIVFCYGTTAEAIKLGPVMSRLTERGVAFEQWVTLQQAATVLDSLPALGIPTPDRVLAVGRSGRPLSGPLDVVVWFARIAWWAMRRRRALRAQLGRGSVIVVHGDTMTSVVGALLARFLRVDSAHVEAGLRSGNWRHPFPEELDRRIVGRLATVHYAPTEVAAGHLTGRRNVVMTHGNTVVDAVLDRRRDATAAPDNPYGVVLLHRFEFLSNSGLVRKTLQCIVDDSPVRLVMVVDDLARHSLQDALATLPTEKVTIVDKLPHAQFAPLIAQAAFIVTDSGGVQEEAAFLGVPTLVHRRATERDEGLGANVVLSGWDLPVLAAFLHEHAAYRREPTSLEHSPSDAVVQDLVDRGYGS